jgi:hypothetical protein
MADPEIPIASDVGPVSAPESVKLAPRATTSKGNLSARVKPRTVTREKSLKAAPKWAVTVVVHQDELDALTKRRQSPGGKALLAQLRRVLPIIKNAAPIAKKPHHGRPPGRLKKNVVGYLGEDAQGLYADVVTRARAGGKDRAYYGRIQNQKGANRKYLERGLKEAGG